MFKDFLYIVAGFIGAFIVTLVSLWVFAPDTLALVFGG